MLHVKCVLREPIPYTGEEMDSGLLSKIENGKVVPSEDLIGRMAEYYNTDRDELLLLAQRIPEDVRRILRENPREALQFLRRRFGANEHRRS